MNREYLRIVEAYLNMAEKAHYRPAAPGDGFGNVDDDYDPADDRLLSEEARKYATEFIRQENTLSFHVGTSNYSTNRALVYVIEAARLLCGAQSELAHTLLAMAMEEISRSGSICAEENIKRILSGDTAR